MLSNDPKSLILVGIQFFVLLYLFLSGVVVPQNPVTLLIMSLGFFLIFWAFWHMRTTTFQITPQPGKGSTLITTGPYKYIRHPMYTGVILIALALLLNFFTFGRFAAFVILVVDLYIKVQFEEDLLKAHFAKQYHEYIQKTASLIPFVY